MIELLGLIFDFVFGVIGFVFGLVFDVFGLVFGLLGAVISIATSLIGFVIVVAIVRWLVKRYRARKAQEKVFKDLDGESFVSYYAQEK